MLTLDTSFGDAWKTILNYKPCADAVKFFSPIAETKVSFEEAIAAIPKDYKGEKVIDCWSTWVLNVLWNNLDRAVKDAFLKKISHYPNILDVYKAVSETDKDLVETRKAETLTASARIR